MTTCPAALRPSAWASCKQRQPAAAWSSAAIKRAGIRRRWPPAPACGRADESETAGFLLPLPQPKKSSQLGPSYWLGREGTVEAQLKALQHNNFPHHDSGLEVLYRFAAFDPFSRSDYFGVNLDLGQFERFRRIFYTPYYSSLLNLSDWDVTSTLEISESQWVARVHVVNAYRKEKRNYAFHLEQRFGGKYDGVWYCSRLLAEGCNAKTLYGII